MLGYDCGRERAEVERLGLPELTKAYLTGDLARGYRAAGFRVDAVERMTTDALRALPSTWAKRLAFGRPRDVWKISATAQRP